MVRIVTDSASDLRTLAGVPFSVASLRIMTAEKEYVDDACLDVAQMANDLAEYKGRSSSSCPNHDDWLCAFGDAEEIICITITSGLSGSFYAERGGLLIGFDVQTATGE